MRFLRLLPVIAALVSTARAQEVEGPPASPMPAALAARVTFHTVLVTEVHAGSLEIRLEHTRLSALRKLHPAMKLHHRGDAGNSETWGCLTVSSSIGEVQLWPSSGELNGGDVVDAVMLQRADATAAPDCPHVDGAAPAPSLDNGVAIGMPLREVISRLGTPSAALFGVMLYGYVTPVSGTKQKCATSGAVTVGFLARRVDRIWASRDTAC